VRSRGRGIASGGPWDQTYNDACSWVGWGEGWCHWGSEKPPRVSVSELSLHTLPLVSSHLCLLVCLSPHGSRLRLGRLNPYPERALPFPQSAQTGLQVHRLLAQTCLVAGLEFWEATGSGGSGPVILVPAGNLERGSGAVAYVPQGTHKQSWQRQKEREIPRKRKGGRERDRETQTQAAIGREDSRRGWSGSQ
jgi:hypothetical protein